MDLVDELVGAPLESDDALQILPIGRAEMGGTLNADVRKAEKQIGELVVLGWSEKTCDGTWRFFQVGDPSATPILAIGARKI
jgi:hypothetical protein